jgi:hypothetical protein
MLALPLKKWHLTSFNHEELDSYYEKWWISLGGSSHGS